MSYFNEEQQEYMEMLSKIPAEEKCECGWYRKSECDYATRGQQGTCSFKCVKGRRDGTFPPKENAGKPQWPLA